MQKINVKELLRLGADNQIRPLHIELGSRSLKKLGELENVCAVSYHPQLTGPDELSFTVYRDNNGVRCRLWEAILDFKLVWVKEYNEWFQIKITLDESETVPKKNITATSLCEAELSQILLYQIEVNTESDIARDDYTTPTLFYHPEVPSSSLLHRILEKAPHYTIAHVDKTLCHLQRSFSIDQTSIYDFMTGTLAHEAGCLFLFDTNTRKIYVYDLQTTCLDCGCRRETPFKTCPECGSSLIHPAYGYDTSIYIDQTNLGNALTLSCNTDSVKNCFRVLGGDALLNAALQMIKPDGSPYIYYFNEEQKRDMPAALLEKMADYDRLYENFANTQVFLLDSERATDYNDIVRYILTWYPGQMISPLGASCTGFTSLTVQYYNTLDTGLYLKNGMMPAFETAEKTAASQLELLTTANLSPVAVTDAGNLSIYTADSAVLAMAKALIDTGLYKVEILESKLVSQTWQGKFKLTAYADKEDTAQSETVIHVEINDDYTAFVQQKITKAMAKINDPGLMDLYRITDLNEFERELCRYCAARLTAYENAYQTAVDVLIEQGIGSPDSDLYTGLYLPYYERLTALKTALNARNRQLETVQAVQAHFETLIADTRNALDFEAYLGPDLWKTWISYRREQEYRNENYVSDGLDNAALIHKAQELLSVAQQELVKSGEKQISITASLQNLLLLTDSNGNRIFEPIFEDFTLGNFIHCKIDGRLYQLRLSDVTLHYDDLSTLSCTFTDAKRSGSASVGAIQEILAQSKAMATSYGTVKKQASQGNQAGYTLEKLRQEGLNSALYNVMSTNARTVIDDHGLLSRSYDDINDRYSDEQMRLNGTNLLFTTNQWRSCKSAVGRQKFTLNGIVQEEYGVNADFILSGKIIAGDLYSANYRTDSNGTLVSGSHMDLTDGSFSLADGKIHYDPAAKKLTLKDFDLNWSISGEPSDSETTGMADFLRNTGSAVNALKAELNAGMDQITAKFTTLETKMDGSTMAVTTLIRESADGIEIGKSDSALKAAFKNDRIEFTENSTVIAAIDQGKFYGTDMELTESGSFKMGNQIWLRRGNGHLSLKSLY